MKTKTKLKIFTIFNFEKEELYLREMNKKGWKLDSISLLGFYHFSECSPEDVIYRLDYNSKNDSNHIKLLENHGWSYVTNYYGYSYFKKDLSLEKNAKEEELFMDNQSKLELSKRIIKGRVYPLLSIFFLLIVPGIYRSFSLVISGDKDAKVILSIFVILFILYSIIFFSVTYNYQKIKRRLNN